MNTYIFPSAERWKQTCQLIRGMGSFLLAVLVVSAPGVAGEQDEKQMSTLSPPTALEITSPETSRSDQYDLLVAVPQAKLVLIDDVSVSTRDAGFVERVNVREGDSVLMDGIVVELDRELYEAELESAKRQRLIDQKESENNVDIQYAEKSSAVNQQVLERSKNAVAAYEKSISKTELERLGLELQRSRLSRQQAIHASEVKRLTCELRLSQEMLGRMRLRHRTIKSPLSGQVVDVFVQPGQFVAAGQPLVRIVRLDRLEVEAYVDSESIFRLKSEQPAEFRFQRNGESIQAAGQVIFVSPEIDPLNGDFKVLVEIENADQWFRPGMVGELLIFDAKDR